MQEKKDVIIEYNFQVINDQLDLRDKLKKKEVKYIESN